MTALSSSARAAQAVADEAARVATVRPQPRTRRAWQPSRPQPRRQPKSRPHWTIRQSADAAQQVAARCAAGAAERAGAQQQEQDLANDDAGVLSAEEQRILAEGFTGDDGTSYSPSTVQRGCHELVYPTRQLSPRIFALWHRLWGVPDVLANCRATGKT